MRGRLWAAATLLYKARAWLTPALVVTAGLFSSQQPSAAVISSPASIVDHGSYITDTANVLDWYKFSNAETTVGLSYNQVVASAFFATGSWRVASISEVNSLWYQFGWRYDTEYAGITENIGLADALIGKLGYTFESYNPTSYDSRGILARYAGTLHEAHETAWVYRETHANPSVEVHLDFVSSAWGLVGDNVANNYGTWLVRSAPEPSTLALLSLGLAGLASSRRRRQR